MKNQIITFGVAATMLGAPFASKAQISLVSSEITNSFLTPSASLTVPSFDLAAGNALVVVVNSEANNGSGTPAYSVTFGGMTVLDNVFVNQGAQGAGIFYWINPTTTLGDVVVTLNGSSTLDRSAVSVLSLGNVLGIGDSQTITATSGGASGSPTFSITYNGTAGGLAVAGFVDNGSSVTTVPSITDVNMDAILQGFGANYGGGSAGMIQHHGDIAAAGSFTADFKASRDGSSSSRNAAALVAFTAISVPEPGTLALFGLGALALIIRRRK